MRFRSPRTLPRNPRISYASRTSKSSGLYWPLSASGERAMRFVDNDDFDKVASLQRAMDKRSGRARGAQITDSDIANGRRLAAKFGQDLHYTAEHGWLVWDGRRWPHDHGSVRVQTLAKHVALSIYDEVKGAADKTEMYKHARQSQSRRAVEAMIWCARSDLITRVIPITYAADALCPRWDAFLTQVTIENAELADYLRRMVGYLLTGCTFEQVLHFLFGLGANGKSVFCELIADLMGEYAIVVSPEMLMSKKHGGGIPNDVARLRGARVALMNETSQGSAFDEAKLKDLTGSDSINARFLRAEFFDFKPTHKLLVRGNHKPAISGTDDGIWRRLRLLPFARLFAGDEQDPRLLEKLREELPGILAWAVRGCLEWQSSGLKAPAIITEASVEYRSDSDTLGKFLDEKCERRKLAQVKAGMLYRAYQDFAKDIGERSMASKDLPHEMKRRGFDWKRTNQGGLYLGVELRGTDMPDWRNND